MPKFNETLTTQGYFEIDDLPYQKGDWRPIFNNTLETVTIQSKSLNDVTPQLVRQTNYSEWTNSSNTPYGSYQALIDAFKAAFFFNLGTFGSSNIKVTYYEIIDISTATIGSLQEAPTGSTIQEGEFGESGNSVLSTINTSSKPSYESPINGVGDAVTVNIGTNGDWVASDNYADPVALIYSYVISGSNWSFVDVNNMIDYFETGVKDHSGLILDDGTNPHGTNKTDIGLDQVDNIQQYPISNPLGFEIPLDLDARDSANRDRANHTNTQLANTISDFDTTVSNNTDVTGSVNVHSDVDLIGLAVPKDGWISKLVNGSLTYCMLEHAFYTGAPVINTTANTPDPTTPLFWDFDFQRLGTYSVKVSFSYSFDATNASIVVVPTLDGDTLANITDGEMIRKEPKDAGGNDGDGRGTSQKESNGSKIYLYTATTIGSKEFRLDHFGTSGQEASIWDVSLTIEEIFNP